MIKEDLSALQIHKLTQEQFDRVNSSGGLDKNAMYLTPLEKSTIEVSKTAGVTKLTFTNTDGTNGESTTVEILDGRTPSKGEDYYTEKDKEEIIAGVVEAIDEDQVSTIDVSNFKNGSFTEVINGETVTHTVVFDESGKLPVKIDGVTIIWR